MFKNLSIILYSALPSKNNLTPQNLILRKSTLSLPIGRFTNISPREIFLGLTDRVGQ
jgi:hypothetical protein